MKKINLRGINESLSEREMKKIRGGDDKKQCPLLAPDPCAGSKLGAACKITSLSSGAEVSGSCHGTFDGGLVCKS